MSIAHLFYVLFLMRKESTIYVVRMYIHAFHIGLFEFSMSRREILLSLNHGIYSKLTYLEFVVITVSLQECFIRDIAMLIRYITFVLPIIYEMHTIS